MRRAGLALLIVVGVLGILAVLAAAFVTMAQLERRASAQRLNATKALLLARSGIEDALARLTAGQAAEYGGENWDNDFPATLNGPEIAAEVYGPGLLDVETCPVRHALRPSFFAQDPASLGADLKYPPKLQIVEGRERGYSGMLQGGGYALKVEDESAKIDVNGGFLDGGDRDNGGAGDGIADHQDPDPQSGWNAQLVRILNLLGQQPEVGIANLGLKLIRKRPLGGYASMSQVQAAAGAQEDLSPYLTTASWADLKVVRPNSPVGDPMDNGTGSLSNLKLMRPRLALEEGGRPPVNLNAAVRPVLAALVANLEGVCWQFELWPVNFRIPPAMADLTAASMIAQRPFADWEAFSAFCDSLVPGGVIQGMAGNWQAGGNLCGADLLKANFDPNTDLNKQLADRRMWRWIDKSDLTTWSTEGSLGPTGVFRIACVGRVAGPDGKVRAEQAVSVLTEAFSLLRQTSQRDFVDGRTYLPDYLSLSKDALDPTTGVSASSAWWGGTPPGQGISALTTPCPPTALPDNAAEFDGAIGLATYELKPPGTCLFLHHFDDGWTADSGVTALKSAPSDAALQPDLKAGVWPDPALPAPACYPNTLYPDGAHVQASQSPAFDSIGNFPVSWTTGIPPSNHGVIGYWTKTTPPHLTSATGRAHFDMSCVRTSGLNTHFVGVGASGDLWGITAENRISLTVDAQYERQARLTFTATTDVAGRTLLPGLHWTLVTAAFDTDQAAVGDDVHLAVWNARGKAWPPPGTYYTQPFLTSQGEDLLSTGSFLDAGCPQNAYGDARSVVDELAVLDLLDNGPAAFLRADIWHKDRYLIGRYYRLDDATFLSTLLDPAPGQPVRLLRAAWTLRLPGDDRLDTLSLNQVAQTLGQPSLEDPILAQSSADLELLDAAGTLTSPPLTRLVQGGPVQMTLSGFRYRLTLKPHPVNPATGVHDPSDQPVLESPWLDDITFTTMPREGPRILAWER